QAVAIYVHEEVAAHRGAVGDDGGVGDVPDAARTRRQRHAGDREHAWDRTGDSHTTIGDGIGPYGPVRPVYLNEVRQHIEMGHHAGGRSTTRADHFGVEQVRHLLLGHHGGDGPRTAVGVRDGEVERRVAAKRVERHGGCGDERVRGRTTQQVV